MKRCFLILVALWQAGASLQAQPSQEHRTDINPALLYWQAIVLRPVQSDEDRDYLLTNEWRGRPLDDRFRSLVIAPNTAFRLIEQAGRQTAPCDWGYDITYGPTMLLPGLAKGKSFAQIERLRFRWHLESGRSEDAVHEWLATFALSHQLSRDGTLISCLVQFAMDNILLCGVAENWFRLDDAALLAIQKGMPSIPRAGTTLDSNTIERTAFRDWFIRQVEAIHRSTPDLELRRKLILTQFEETSPGEADLGKKVLAAGGNTGEGVIRLLTDLDPLYTEAAELIRMPYAGFREHAPVFDSHLKSNLNPLAGAFLNGIQKSRLKEFTAISRAALFQAALARRLQGEKGFQAVLDPLTGKPFALKRIQVGGIDRGFQIGSTVTDADGLPLSLIFIEKDGPAFNLDGRQAGELLK